jgi:hypothetical protein
MNIDQFASIDQTTIIPCKSSAVINLDTIKTELQKIAPAAELKDDLAGPASGVPDSSGGYLVSYDGISMAILSFTRPLPVDTLVYGPSPNFFWPTAENDLSSHATHVRVLVTQQIKTRAEFIAAAKALTYLTAAVCKAVPAMAVLWCAADHLLSVERYLLIATAPESPGKTFAPIWVRILAANTPEGVVVATHGLSGFAGREIEFAPNSKFDFATLGMRTMQMSHLLIESAVEWGNGEIVAPERFRVTIPASEKFYGSPAYSLSASAA